ncbi:MAG: hypothetical protein AAF570_26160, partial [Bacteroidota bacterium]
LNVPGGTANYTINYQVSDFITAIDSFVITVVVEDGQDYAGNAMLNGNPIVPNSVLLNTPGVGQTTVTFFVVQAIGQIGPGGSGSLTYDATVRQNYQATGDPVLTRDNLGSNATVDYHLTDENPGTSGCSYACSASYTIEDVSLTKTIPSGITTYDPGDIVTYRIRMEIPSGDADGVSVTDFFPLPIHDVATLNLTWGGPDIVPTANNNVANIPTLSINPATNGLIADFGNIVTASPPSIIEYEVSIGLTTIPYADGLFHSNFVQGVTNNTVVDAESGLDGTLIRVNAPELVITKGVSATDNPNASISPAPTFPIDGDATDADGRDTVTYVVSIENTGAATAFDVKVTDSIPAALHSCALVSVTRGDGSPFPFTPTGNPFPLSTDTLFLDSLRPDMDPNTLDIALITYQCIIDST